MTSLEPLRRRLQATSRAEHILFVLNGLFTSATIVSAVVVAFIIFEAFAHGSMQIRTAMWWAIVATGITSPLVLMTMPVLRLLGVISSASIEELALRVGRFYDDVGDRLCNALQLETTSAALASGSLRDAAVHAAHSVAAPKDFSVIIDRRPTRRAAIWATFTLALALGLPAALPHTFGAAWERIVRYDESFLPPPPYSLQIETSDTSAMRGSSIRIAVTSQGTAPESITMFIREGASGRFAPFEVRRDTSGTYTYQITGLQSDVAVYARGAWLETGVVTDTAMVRVYDRPLLRAMTGRVIPPSYTRLPPQAIDEGNADVAALVGSTVDLTITANKDITSADIVIVQGAEGALDTIRVPMSPRGSVTTGRFTLTSSGTYHVELRDKAGLTNVDPVAWRLVAMSDGYPTIAMIEPTKDIDIDPKARLPIRVTITDDYGFSSLKLHYRLVKSRYAQAESKFTSKDVAISGDGTVRDVATIWDLAGIGITPDDVYEFYLEVADNDVVAGPKTAKTSTYKVRLPSLEEVFAQTDRTQSEVSKEMKELAKEADEIRKEAETLQRELQKQQAAQGKELSWNEAKKAEELVKRQAELEKRMEAAAEKIEKMTEQLQQNNAISPETLEKYMELQKLMREVKSPELERLQKEMERAMENMSPEDLQNAMKDFKFDEEQFKKNIERTMNLLKRTQAEQKADELAKRAEELAQRQRELEQQARNANPNDKQQRDQLAREQQDLQKRFDELAKETKELEKLMNDVRQDMPLDMMEQAKKDLDESKTSQAMKDAQQDLERGDMDEASESQTSAADNMERFAQQMQQMKKQMRRNSARDAMRQMQKNVNDLLELSKQQESLQDKTEGTDAGSNQFPQLAQQQQKIREAMQNIASNMMQLGQKSMSVTPEMAQDMGDALQSMQGAMEQLQGRNGQMAAKDQGDALSAMNSAIQKMSNALGQMMAGEGQGQGGSGQNPGMGKGKGPQSPFQRLQELADQQQGINQGMQQLGGQGQMSEKQRAEMGRLAAQQGQALRALEEMEKERKDVGGEKQPVGDLKKIADDMREVMTDMQSGSITPETRLRQERILSRLLDASRSFNDRDYEKSRESRSGTDVRRQSPSALDLEDRQRRLELLRETQQRVKSTYTTEYERLIRVYMDKIGQGSTNK